ncbi:NADPH:quinone oxidoreductase family protein [Pseudohoeflea coraliihabitans]|uniref:NADPH:quinone oxidoreductase family protein n=1 Tax=Pseudohoeflea coraliihabitans TaxID=2860393 RepID=A0ABS6WMR2_9HYPH|nr:NADPH:quinone oxidoreductase family protein [Pseudohoeflea sp. DP4N28-3]MBW3097249.1 NADPH:quinone oxidoreductase family protein [Pseudohoeflea sp. DP4N28-3]
MKAVVIHDFGPVGSAPVEDIATPEPGRGEVLVRIAAVAANFVDTLVLTGKYQFLPQRPFTPGKLPVGTVEAVGPDVADIKVGDRVLTLAEHGGYAEAISVGADQCILLPDTLSFPDAASMALAYDTAWFALMERARLEKGNTVLVLGATGAVGLAAMQLARAKGCRVLAGISSAKKTDLVRKAGADELIDLSGDNLRDSLREQVHSATDGRGADIIVDALGGDFFDAALRALAWRGRLVVIGFASGRIPEVKANYLLLKNIEVSGLQISDYRKRMPELMRQCFVDIFSLYERGAIAAAPPTIFTLSDYHVALTGLLERRIAGRAVICP